MRTRGNNVLLITADEMRGDSWGGAGNADVPTPHLDRLAGRGTVFESHFTPFPKCVPARCSMHTGRYCHTDGRGLKRDILYCYDLALPADFDPVCADGEVESFELLPIESVLDLIATTDRFKYNCNLVIVDFAIRHGVLTGDNTPEYAALCARANQLQWL